LEETRKEADEMAESAKIYASVMAERRKNLVNKYLSSYQGHDDLERMLEALFSHFKLIKMTSFEELTQDNPELAGSKDLIYRSK
jgi:hypothetical protein